MRVGVDATVLAPGAPGGVRTACRLLLGALAQHAPEVKLLAFAPRPVAVPHGVEVVATGGPRSPRRWRRSPELRDAAASLDVFHSPVTAFPDLPGVVVTSTVHELPFVENHRLEGAWRAWAQLRWLTRAMGRCAALVAPSEATVRQLRLAHPAAVRLARLVPHPAPPAPAEEQKAHDGSLLFVGRLDRRKGVEALLRGARGTAGEIRLAGAHGAAGRARVLAAAARAGVGDRLRFLGVLSDAELDGFYRRACVVGLVSASEGFGFPVLEALARSVPVVVARGTGAAEVGGEAALVVDPTRPGEIAAALRRAAEPEFRARVARLGPARALAFSALRTARGYVEVFTRALGR